jgi:hypothetical protein
MMVSPPDALMQLAAGALVSRSLHVVADLGVADALDETPRTVAELAAATGAHASALDRTLRLLSSYGVFETHDGKVAHTPSSRLLRADHPQSMRAGVRLWGLPIIQDSYQHMDVSLRTGQPATNEVAPRGFFSYFADHPDEGRAFGEAMTAKSHGAVAGILGAYDFSPFAVIGDIGGGHGHLLQAILESAPSARGVLFDLPDVIRDAAPLASERLSLVAGDFFADMLPQCDAYVMMEIIHDWNDEQAAAILHAVRRAAPEHATLLLIEAIVPDDPGPQWPKTLDIAMLAITGGLQRSTPEYVALLGATGFRLEGIIETGAGVSILEARTI